MKFSEFRSKRGKVRKPKVIDYPLYVGDGKTEAIPVGLRFLPGDETSQILSSAETFARDGGSENPTAGDPLYELGLRIYTLLFACVDPDAPDHESVSARFFSSIDEILERKEFANKPLIGRDGIAFLYESQEAWQDFCAPQSKHLSESEFWAAVVEVAGSEDPLSFEGLRPGVRWSFSRSMAQQLLTLLTKRSESGSISSESSKTPKKPSRKTSRKRTVKK